MSKNRKSENHEPHKQSDRRWLSADARILVALMKQQPQSRNDLCRNASINESTFYRIRRFLRNEGILQETQRGYALWNYVELTSLWDRFKCRLERVGGYVIKLDVDRFLRQSGASDPSTGWPIPIYEVRETIQGIVILRKATELRFAANIEIPSQYEAALVTPDFIKNDDCVWWNGQSYTFVNIQEVYDGYNLSYRHGFLYRNEHETDKK